MFPVPTMAEDEGKQEEKFDFTREGQVLGYMSRGPSVVA